MAHTRMLTRTPQHEPRLAGIGLDFSTDNMHAMVWHDLTGSVGHEVLEIVRTTAGKCDERHAVPTIVKLLRAAEIKGGIDVRLVAFADPLPYAVLDDLPKIWLHVDAIPVHIPTRLHTLRSTPGARAKYAVEHSIPGLHPASSSATLPKVRDTDHQVLVDAVDGGSVYIAGRREYEQSTSPELYFRFKGLAHHLRHTRRMSMAFFSATPQGGGVALMRHALVRLWRLYNIDVSWYVPEAHPIIFDITKRKLHNVLQGVAPEGVEITEKDKADFEEWTRQNYETYWSSVDADIVVIDDPQLAPIIPYIRRYTRARIIFRSHIQIRGDLVDTPGTPQQRTWDYLFSFVKETDLFLSHPVQAFVPKNVLENMKVLYSPPSTDPVDGLNKPYGALSIDFFRDDFDHLAMQQSGVAIDWSRGYIVQVARFDPSKGLDVLLAAYLRFRELAGDARAPHLIIVGHGSIDDPDGLPMLDKVRDTLATPEYAPVKDDVAVVRAPPSDSLLGVLVQGAWVVTQLSTREGFEIKVTEAVDRRVPIIVSDAGGIPLQVRPHQGWVVPAGQAEPVATLLHDIYRGKETLDGKPVAPPGKSAVDAKAEQWVQDINAPLPQRTTSEDFWTIGNAAKWMLLAARLLENPIGNGQYEEVLRGMSVDKPLPNGKHVWELLMGKDMKEGEAQIRSLKEYQ